MRSLSGGERNRLLLARLFARPANVLVLDEPTNDLDIDTLELLEDLLQNYDGTVFLVSHDRTFLDNVVTSTIAFEGDGRWREYEGSVQDWLTQSQARSRDRRPERRGISRRARRPRRRAPAPAAAAAPGDRARSSATRSSANSRPCPRGSPRWKRSRSASPKCSSSTAAPSTPARPRAPPNSAQRHAQIDEELLAALERWEELGSARQG